MIERISNATPYIFAVAAFSLWAAVLATADWPALLGWIAGAG